MMLTYHLLCAKKRIVLCPLYVHLDERGRFRQYGIERHCPNHIALCIRSGLQP